MKRIFNAIGNLFSKKESTDDHFFFFNAVITFRFRGEHIIKMEVVHKGDDYNEAKAVIMDELEMAIAESSIELKKVFLTEKQRKAAKEYLNAKVN